MNQSSMQWRRWLLAFAATCLMVPSLATLTGCAGQQGPGASTQKDLATDSDDTEGRKRARLRLELAVGYFEQGQTNVALDELKQALGADPTYSDAYNLRGLIYMRMNEIPLAEDSFRRAISLNPRDGDVLHNYGWLLCQQARYAEANQYFQQAVALPQYTSQAKTFMAQGMCQVRAGQKAEGEKSLLHAYEMNPANSITGYNLALLNYQRSDFQRAQFYIRRINNSEQANAESLWLGVKVERRMENTQAMAQLGSQLKRRYPGSKEAGAYDRRSFDE